MSEKQSLNQQNKIEDHSLENNSMTSSDKAVKSFTPPNSGINPIVNQRKESLEQKDTQEMINDSSLISKGASIQAQLNNSSAMVAQRKRLNALFGGDKSESNVVTQRKKEEEQEPIQKQSSSGGSDKMPESIQEKMENSFNADFSGVTIHNNSSSATDMNALAYTQGKDIHFAPGQYNPESQTGQELLGHELTHVVQQSQGRVGATTQAKGTNINDDPALEKEADEMGKQAVQGKMIDTASIGKGNGVQKKAKNFIFKHRVLKNETLVDIAMYYNVSLTTLMDYNQLCDGKEPAEGTMLDVPSPEEDKPKEKSKETQKPDLDKGKGDLGLKNQKNQVVKVTVGDFMEFLKLYNAYHMGQYSLIGAPPKSFSMSEASKLKYLIGPLQNANPKIKEIKDQLEKIIDQDLEKGEAAFNELWKAGFWGKFSVIMTGTVVGAAAGASLYNSVEIILQGNNKKNSLGFDFHELSVNGAMSLLSNLKYEKKNKDLSGNITDKDVQEGFKVGVVNKDDKVGAEFKISTDANSKIDDDNWKDLKSNGYADKRTWYVPEKQMYIDTITLRNEMQSKSSGITPSTLMIHTDKMLSAPDLLLDEANRTADIYRVKDKKFYSANNISILYKSGVISNSELFAKKGDMMPLSSDPLISAVTLYGKPEATSTFNLEAGVGLNSGLRKPDSYFKGGYQLSVFGDKNTTTFATNFSLMDAYSKDKYKNPSGLEVEDWVHKQVRIFQMSLSEEFKFNTGGLNHSMGGSLGYSNTNSEISKPGLDLEKKIEEKISLSPFWKITYKDPAEGTWALEIKPEFFMLNNKLGMNFTPSLNYLQLNQNSVIKLEIKTHVGENPKTHNNGIQLTGIQVDYFLNF